MFSFNTVALSKATPYVTKTSKMTLTLSMSGKRAVFENEKNFIPHFWCRFDWHFTQISLITFSCPSLRWVSLCWTSLCWVSQRLNYMSKKFYRIVDRSAATIGTVGTTQTIRSNLQKVKNLHFSSKGMFCKTFTVVINCNKLECLLCKSLPPPNIIYEDRAKSLPLEYEFKPCLKTID